MENNSENLWFSELVMEKDPLCSDQYDIMNFLNEDFTAVAEDFQISPLSPTANSNFSTLIQSNNSNTILEVPAEGVDERPAKQCEPNNYDSSPIIEDLPNLHYAASSNPPFIITFGNPETINPKQVTAGPLNPNEFFISQEEEAPNSGKPNKKTGGRHRPASQIYDHVAAERKRREQLSQRFVALSAMLPGLKKMDKSSVLGDAITYVKYLQERVKTLEEQTTEQTMESVVLVKKSQVLFEDEEGSSDETTVKQPALPEIEAKLCGTTILLRIHCKKSKWVLTNLFSQVQKLNLGVTYTSIAPFGSLALDIHIILEMEKESKITMKEVVQTLRSALWCANQED